jgi:hypothetical protein
LENCFSEPGIDECRQPSNQELDDEQPLQGMVCSPSGFDFPREDLQPAMEGPEIRQVTI